MAPLNAPCAQSLRPGNLREAIGRLLVRRLELVGVGAMRAEAIFRPVGLLALWTMLVLVMTAVRRVRAVRAGRVKRSAFRLGESDDVPDDVVIANRNLMNLLEMPLLFYVVCLCLYVTHHVQPRPLGLAWTYVALRIVHSCIHLTSNKVMHRLTVFGLSNVVLTVIWIWL